MNVLLIIGRFVYESLRRLIYKLDELGKEYEKENNKYK